MAVHVQCNSCGAWAITENHALPDAAVRCTSPADDPPGSPEGCCSTLGHTHEEHVAHVAATRDATSRPVTITIMGTATQLVDTPGGPKAVGGPGA
jgi:hypothetical protein